MTQPDQRGGPRLPQHPQVTTAIPGPRSAELHRRRTEAVARGVSSVLPAYVQAAGGGALLDVDGNTLIDFAAGIAVTSVGNSAPAVVDAVTRQAQQFTHTCFMVAPYPEYVQVAEMLNERTPGDFAKKSALFNSGAEAVENAVKIARSYTGRPAVVTFENAYHGRTTLTLAMTAKNAPYKDGFGPFAPEVYRAPMSYPLRDGLDGKQAALRAIDHMETYIGAENVAAVVIEPIQGEGGFVVPAPGFLPELLTWARGHGVVFVADEVQTGFARTGDLFACEHEHLDPDLIVTAKGIAGGLPLSAVTGRAEIMDGPGPGGLGGTYGGNPIACAAALATIATIDSQHLVERAREIEVHIAAALAGSVAADARIAELRGRGAMMAIEFVEPGSLAPNAALTKRVAQIAHSQGLLLLTCGMHGNVIRLLPPLAIGSDLLAAGLDILAGAIAEA